MQSPTFKICTQYCFHIGRLYRSKRLVPKKHLLQCASSLTEVKQEQLHQPGLSICSKNLLQSIDAQRTLILESWRWQAAMLGRDHLVLLDCVRVYFTADRCRKKHTLFCRYLAYFCRMYPKTIRSNTPARNGVYILYGVESRCGKRDFGMERGRRDQKTIIRALACCVSMFNLVFQSCTLVLLV